MSQHSSTDGQSASANPTPAPRYAGSGAVFRSPSERRAIRREERQTRQETVDNWLVGLLVAIVVGSVLAIGSAHTRTLLVVSFVSVVAAVLAMQMHRMRTGSWPVTLPVFGVFLLTLWTALQALPLPAGLVSVLAPHNADTWKHALDPIGGSGPSWHPISLDPGATWVEALKGITYTSVLLLSSVVGFRKSSSIGVGTVFVSALLVGLFTIAHGLAGVDKVFGIYQPLFFRSPWSMSPLLNSNHLSGYLNLGAMCGLGIMLARQTKIPRWLSGTGVATLIGMSILAASRGAAALLPFGVAIVVALIAISQRSKQRSRDRRNSETTPDETDEPRRHDTNSDSDRRTQLQRTEPRPDNAKHTETHSSDGSADASGTSTETETLTDIAPESAEVSASDVVPSNDGAASASGESRQHIHRIASRLEPRTRLGRVRDVSDAPLGERSSLGPSVPTRWLVGLTIATVSAGAILTVLGFASAQWRMLFDDDLSKLSVVHWARPMIADHLWFGVGRGAFETVFPAYSPVTGNQLWTHPENIAVQWASEWGVPVSVIAFLFFAYMLRPTIIGANRSAVAAGAAGGIVIVALQNIVDFSLEMPGVTIAVMVLLGSCWGDTRKRGLAQTLGSARTRSLGRYSLGVAFALAGIVAIAMVATRGMRTALDDRRAFQSISLSAPPRTVFEPLVRDAMLRHPAEPYFAFVGAERAWRRRDADPVRYLQRLFSRSKHHGRGHLLLADILFARGARNQAMMELKYACADEPALATASVAMAVRQKIHGADFERLVPEGDARIHVLDTLAAWMHSRNPELGRRFDAIVLDSQPTRVGPLERRIKDRIATLKSATDPQCAGDIERRECIKQIETDVLLIESSEPLTSRAPRLRAEALVAMGKLEAADKLLADACETVTDRLVCLRARVPLAISLGSEEGLDKLLDMVAAAGCSTSQACSQSSIWVGSVQRDQNNLGAAVNSYRRATRHDPQNLAAWVLLGDTSSAMGLHGQAAMAYEHACKLAPDDKKLREKFDRSRKEAVLGPR